MATGKIEFPHYTKTHHTSVYPAIDPSNPSNSAQGKVVLITGGNAGVGKGIAHAFVKAGAKAIAIVGRNEKTLASTRAELEKAGGSTKILSFVADVLDAPSLNRAFEQTAKEVGNIDVVMSNAGYFPQVGLITSSDAGEWWKGFEINVKGTFLTFQAWTPYRGTNSPTFISTNTAAAHAGLFPAISGYGASKLATAQVVAYLQVENPDVKIVSFHPGAIETDMYIKAQVNIELDDISLPAGFAVWLASDKAGDWVKGRLLWAHWDVEELEAMKGRIEGGNELMLGLVGWPKSAA